MSRQVKFVKGQMIEFELYKLVDSYDPVLKSKPTVFDFNQSGARSLATYHAISLLETMSKNHGVGLAANQVGLDTRLFVMGSQGVGYAFFNPEIIDVSGETVFEEGCLSFPGLFLPVKRPEIVKIKYFDMYGEEKTQEFSGLSARIVLHEYDHMEGIVYTTKVSPLILERYKRKVKKNLKLLEAQYERIEKQEIIRQAAEALFLKERKNWSQEEVDYMAEHPDLTIDRVREILAANAQTAPAVEGPKRDIKYAQPVVDYVVDPAPKKENNQQDQTLTIEVPNPLILEQK